MNPRSDGENSLKQTFSSVQQTKVSPDQQSSHVIQDEELENPQQLEGSLIEGNLPSTQSACSSNEAPSSSIHNSQDCTVASDDEQKMPKINCPEKIILCFDLSSELKEVIMNRIVVFELLKKSVDMFIKHKLRFNKKHEFAIVTFAKEALWVQDFSNDLSLIMDTLHNIDPNPDEPCPQFDMSSLLEILENHVELPLSSTIPDIPPEYVVRVILMYGRSHSDVPSLKTEQAAKIFNNFISSPLFFFDVLYVHEIPDGENNCEDIYDALCTLDETEKCYVLEVSTYVAARLSEFTAKLLAHPLQRPRQQDVEYSLAESPYQSS